MHDIKAIRENPQAFDEGMARRSLPPRAESLLALDDRRRAAILELQKAQERRNAASKEIGAAMARKDAVVAEALKDEVARLKVAMPELEAAEKAAGMVLDNELAAIPNLPALDTPDGKDENDNVEVRRFGAPPKFPDGFKPKEHFEIGEALGLMDFDAAAKLSGARFVVLKGRAGAARARADAVHARPAHARARLRRDQSAAAGARRGDVRHGAVAEVPRRSVRRRRRILADPHRRSAADQSGAREHRRGERLPLRFTAGTLCFRAEAGAAGRTRAA